ncbi:MAG TPA: TonB-dependent receptor [Chitinophagaceae bacterium]|nr:TonB-dependent receptor [Chitinophagaceae bacterium]
MKNTLTGLLLLLICQHCFCQVTGTLVNAGGRPVAAANILLFKNNDTVFTKRAVTDEKGLFEIDNVAPGNYTLRCTSIGYQTLQAPPFTVDATHTIVAMGTLVMADEVKQLDGVVVRAEKPPYRQSAEGIVVNVENNLLAKGSSALEVLEHSPGVIVDRHNNSILLNGKSGVNVMINGKVQRMSMEQLLSFLSGMSADDIATIELLNTPGAKYDAEGNAGIINIVLKKTRKKGTNGGITATAGYGKYEKASLSTRISHNTRRFAVNGSYAFYHNKTYSFLDAYGSENVPALNGEAGFTYKGIGQSRSGSHNFNAGADVYLTPKLTVGASVNYNTSITNASNLNRDVYTLGTDSTLHFEGTIQSVSHWHNTIASVYLEKQMHEEEKLTVDADYLRYNINSPATVQGLFNDKDGNAAGLSGDSLFAPQQRGYNSALIQVGVFKADYTKPLGKKVKMDAGIKGSYTRSDASSGIESFINGQWVSTTETVNNIVMKEGIGAAYASFNTQITPTVNLVTGLRYEYYDTRANNGQTGVNVFKRSLGQLFPGVFLTKKISDNSSLQVSYTKRITRPSYNDLASFVSYNDPLSVFTGNPLLKPTITHNIKFGYNYGGYLFSLLFSRDNNLIAQGQLTQSPSGYIVLISPQNIAWQNSVLLQATIPVKVNNWWSMNYSVLGAWKQYKVTYPLQPAKKAFVSWSGNMRQTFTLPKGFSAELSAQFYSRWYYASDEILPDGSIDIGFKKELGNNKGTIQLTAEDISGTNGFRSNRGGFTHEAFDTKVYIHWHAETNVFPIIRLTYSRTFGSNSQKAHKANLDDEKDRVK